MDYTQYKQYNEDLRNRLTVPMQYDKMITLIMRDNSFLKDEEDATFIVNMCIRNATKDGPTYEGYCESAGCIAQQFLGEEGDACVSLSLAIMSTGIHDELGDAVRNRHLPKPITPVVTAVEYDEDCCY